MSTTASGQCRKCGLWKPTPGTAFVGPFCRCPETSCAVYHNGAPCPGYPTPFFVESMTWQKAAQRLGEELAKTGPIGYYAFTPEQWLEWAINELRNK